jgi:replicative DNA helicase
MADGNPPDLAGIVPRHDLDAEGVCLGMALTDHDAALELVELLAPADYYADANRRVHMAIQALAQRGDPVDVTGVVGELRTTKRLEQVGGTAYLARLMEHPWGNLEVHARTVRNWARVRRAIDVFRRLVAEGTAEAVTDVDGWLDSCERRAFDATTNEAQGRQTTALYADAGAIIQAGWDEVAASSKRTWGLATGFERLDEHTMGMRAGQLWYLGARPGQGKSGFAQQLAEQVAGAGDHEDAVIFMSMEMAREELIVRAVARESGVSHRKIQRCEVETEIGFGPISDGTRTLHGLPILIDDEKNLTPLRLRAKVRRHVATLRAKYPRARVRLVVIDYIQLMHDDRQHGTRAGELGAISRAFKILAGELECTVLALSQLSRPDKTKPPTAPTLFEFRDSGAIEADGDIVLGLHRMDQYRKPGEERDGVCEVHVLKGRGCGEASFELLFDGPTTRFSNVTLESDRLWNREAHR